jgi:vacuolar-type H+-ATPase subunit H
MVKEILTSIIEAETAAEETERAALERSRQIKADAVNAADDLRRAAERSLKEEIKRLLDKARADGEAQAAERIRRAAKTGAPESDKAATARAALYIEKEFYGKLEKTER